MNKDSFKEILYENDEGTGIVTLTINTPGRKNAISLATSSELMMAVDIMEKDASSKVMIITGAKDPENTDPSAEAFSSGGYFNKEALQSFNDEQKDTDELEDIALKTLFLKFWKLEKPVIAAINGLAVGIGFTMPLSCADLIYISEHAWLKMPFVNIGLLPEFASTYVLPRLLGFQKAKELIYFGKKITAEEAAELGLANKVLPHEELLPYAKKMALKLIPPEGAGLAVNLTKKALHAPLIREMSAALDLENEGLNKAVTTADFQEAVSSRIERRKPVFKGK